MKIIDILASFSISAYYLESAVINYIQRRPDLESGICNPIKGIFKNFTITALGWMDKGEESKNVEVFEMH